MLRFATLLVLLALPSGAAAQLASVTVTTLADLDASGDVEVGPDGNIYVADFGESLSGGTPGTTVFRVTPQGAIDTFAVGFVGASGNAFDAEGNLFQSNIGGGYLSKVTPAGVVSTFASNGIAGPVGIAIGADGTVYNTNCVSGPGYITQTTPDGTSTTILATSALMSCPNGLTIDSGGNLYTANFNNGRILKITSDGTVSLLATVNATAGNGHLTFANGRLYVCNWSGRLYEVTLDGQSRVLAGTGASGTLDGPGDQATFFRPNGISATPTGDTLYINQTSEIVPLPQIHPNNVRMITGVLTTVASEVGSETETGVHLRPVQPNPVSESAQVAFTLAAPAVVSLALFDVLGRRVREVAAGEHRGAGEHRISIAARSLPSGAYRLRLEVASASGARASVTQPLLIVR